MKNKKSIYILLPIVLLIWGLVAYQFFSFSTEAPEEVNQAGVINFEPIQIKSSDGSAFSVDYRDPFLGKMYNANTVKHTPKKKHPVAKMPVKKEPIVFPKIAYKGIVSDTKDKMRVFMIIINGHTYLMRKGEIESEVLLKDGNKEMVVIKFKGAELSIPLQV